MTKPELPREVVELETLFSILNVNPTHAAIKAGVSPRAMRRYFSSDNSPSVDKLNAIRVSVFRMAQESGAITRAARKAIRDRIGSHMLADLDAVIG